MIHDRDGSDVYRWFPVMRYLSQPMQERIRWWLWPFRVRMIRTTLSAPNGESVEGWLLSIVLTAEQMIRDHACVRRSRQKIDQLFDLADGLGLAIVGLGAYSASITRLGKSIKGRESPDAARPTSGHAFTCATILANIKYVCGLRDIDLSNCTVAIVGVGSIGATCARLLACKVKQLILVDVIESRARNVAQEILSSYVHVGGGGGVTASDSIQDVVAADIIITATTAPSAILKPEYLRPGMIIIDDAQPRNIDRVTAELAGVLVVDGGIVHHPDIRVDFDFGLCSPHDMWGCLAESILLSSMGDGAVCTVGVPSLDMVRKLEAEARRLGFQTVIRSFDEPA